MSDWVSQRRSAGPTWAFPLVFAIAGAVRAFDLGRRSLWTDEGSTWTAASLPVPELLRRCLERDASPPLHYLLTKLAISGDDSEAMLRVVPMLASLGLVWLTYRLARLALPRGESAFAALLVALSPYQVMYAQEARTYMTVALFGVLGTYLFARAIASDRSRAWPAYALATALGLWTQSLALLALPAQAVVAFVTPAARRRLLPWGLALAAAALAYAPWAWASREMTAHLTSSHWYIDEPDASGVFKVLRAVLVSPIALVTPPPGSSLPGLDRFMPRLLAWGLVSLPMLLLLLVTLPMLPRPGARGHLARVAWAAWLVPLLLVFVVSFQKPLFLPRYFVFTTPYLAVLAALALAEIRAARLLRDSLAVLVAAAALLGLLRYRADYSKEPWRDAAAYLSRSAELGQTVALVTYDADPLRYYVQRDTLAVAVREVGHPAEPFAAAFTPQQLDELEARARIDAAPFDDVWVLVRSANSEVRREVARRAERVAAEGRVEVERRQWDSASGYVRAVRFRRVSSTPDSLRVR